MNPNLRAFLMDVGFWAFLLFAGVSIVLYFLIRFLRKKNDESFSKVADQLSFQFTGDVDLAFTGDVDATGKVAIDRFPLFLIGTPFRHGMDLLGALKGSIEQLTFIELIRGIRGTLYKRNVLLRNTICGKKGPIEVTIFDYSFRVRSHHWFERFSIHVELDTFNQTVICFQNRTSSLPQFQMRFIEGHGELKGDGERLFGNRSVEFGDHPKFSTFWEVRGASKRAVRRLFSDPFIEYLEKIEAPFSIEGSGNQLIIYQPGEVISPKGIFRFYKKSLKVYSHLLKSATKTQHPEVP